MLTFLHKLPEDSCVFLGWQNTSDGLPDSNPKNLRYRDSTAWSLGNPVRFYVMIYETFGLETGVGSGYAEVYFKTQDKTFKHLTDIRLPNPHDILGVVDHLQKAFENSKSEEACVWKAVMKDLTTDLKNAMSPNSKIKIDEESFYDEAPGFIQEVANDWRYTIIDDNTPDDLLEAYIRFEKSWVAYTSNILLNQYGDIYREELRRSDNIGLLLDRKLRSTESTERMTWLMNLYRIMMPCYIGTYEEIEESNVEFENKWNKCVADDIIKELNPIDHQKVQLLIRVREDNKRLPSALSKYIRTEIPKYISDNQTLLEKESDMTSQRLRDTICWLDNYIQWNILILDPTKETSLVGNKFLDKIAPYIETEEDLQILALYSNLLTTCFAGKGTRKDREKFYKRIEEKLRNIERIPETQPSNAKEGSKKAIKALTEEFTLAALYLENLFLEKESMDIYTYYWHLHQRNLAERQSEKENGYFDLWF